MGGTTTALSKAMRILMSIILAFSLSIGYALVEAHSVSSVAYAADDTAAATTDISTFKAVPGDQFYTGKAITPFKGSFKFKDTENKTQRLSEGTDYSVEYANNVEVGKATATITGMGKYTGTLTVEFNIVVYSLTVTSAEDTTLTKSFSKEDLAALAESSTDNTNAVSYQYGTNVVSVPAKQYVTMAALEKALGIEKIATVTITAPDGFASTYDGSISKDGYFFPGQTTDAYNTDGAVQVPDVLALQWASEKISTTAQAAADAALKSADMSTEPRGLRGATEEDYTDGNIMGNRFVTNVNDIQIASQYDISKVGIADCGYQFYTGKEIKPYSGRIKSDNGRISEGKDFTVAYTNNVEKGTATAVLTGMGDYKGTVTFQFEIRDYELTVTATDGDQITKTFTQADLAALAQSSTDNEKAVSYQYGMSGSYSVVAVPAKQYVTLAALAKAANIDNVATVTIKAPDGFASSYDGSLSEDGYFFPGQTSSALSTDNAVQVPDVLALQWASEKITSTAQAAADAALKSTDMSTEPRGLRGATKDDYTDGNIMGNRFVTNVDKIDIETMWDVADISIPDCGVQFTNDGKEIQPYSGSINKTANGRIYEGTDYTVSYKDNTAVGTATATITGMGQYKGTVDLTFEIEDYEFTLSVGLDSGSVVQKVYTKEDLETLAASSTDNAVDVSYQGGTKVYVSAAKCYITVDSLMKDAGLVNWTEISFGSTDGWTVTVTADANNNGKFFPAQTQTGYSTENATAVPAVIALEWASEKITSTAQAASEAALKSTETSEVVRNFVGALEDDYVAGKAAAGRFNQNVFNATAHAEQGVVNDGVTTLAGDDRYETMSEIVSQGFGVNSSDVVILTSGKDYPDALAAASLAGAYEAPVLITDTDELSDYAVVQIARLGATKVIIVGGKNSVSEAVEEDLTEVLEIAESDIYRIEGGNRQETSTKVLEVMSGEESIQFDTVIVASGAKFADSLSVGSYAYLKTAPIVLTDNEGNLSEDSIAAIKANANVKNIVIVGGKSSVSEDTQKALEADYSVTRLGGADRYETSNIIATWALSKGLSAHSVFVADGRNFPDALTGAALAGEVGSILVLAAPEGGSAAIDGVIASNADDIKSLVFLGGENSVPQNVKDAAIKAAGLGE